MKMTIKMEKTSFEHVSTDIAVLQRRVKRIEKLLMNNGLSLMPGNTSSSKNFKVVKCCSSFNKSDLAHLFYVLMDENILFFDTIDQDNNRSRMQEFIVDNFTYLGDAGVQTPINIINKQFSEAKGFTYKDKHLKFLDKMLMLIKERRQKIASW